VTARPAVFLDRDGTLIEERSYPTAADDIVPVPGAGRALADLATAGYLRIVLTNQSAVARGLIDEERLAELHRVLEERLTVAGGAFDALYYCPHHPDGMAAAYAHRCRCRKPGPGLLELALAEHDVDLSRSVFIGDSPRDLYVDAGDVAARILVASGHPLEDTSAADHVAEDLPAAVDWLLSRSPAAD